MFFKVCGLRRQEDLDAAWQLGFALCGFIFAEKSPRFLASHNAGLLDSRTLVRVGVFAHNRVREIEEAARTARLDLLQLHGGQEASCLEELAALFGPQRLIRVVWPERSASPEVLQKELDKAAPFCGHFLVDAGSDWGGHGTRLDVHPLTRLHFPRPWILAGGLAADALDKVAALPREQRPAGLDFNSRLESAPGCKEEHLMKAVCDRARSLGLGPAPFASIDRACMP